jgi:hypothetical protein
MILDKKSEWIRRCGMVGVSTLAVVLVAAVVDPDPNWARIRALPPAERTKLLQNLRKFDLELAPDKQQAILELDRQIAQLDPERRARYLWVLRRYHDWLDSIPENKREEVLAQPPDDRLAMIRKLVTPYPVPTSETPELLRVAEVGEISPFELASAFRIWEEANATQRGRVEAKKQVRGRRKALLELGGALKSHIPKETRPPDFDEAHWVGVLEAYWRNKRPEMLFPDAPRNKLEEAAKKNPNFELIRREIHRRQAINLYTIKTPVHAVDPDKLAQFLTALPPWLQSAVDQYPPDEARRRLTWAYRLVFPHPEEYGSARHTANSPSRSAPPAATSKKSGASPARRKPAPTAESNAPF